MKTAKAVLLGVVTLLMMLACVEGSECDPNDKYWTTGKDERTKEGRSAVKFCPPGYELATAESEEEKRACHEYIKCLKNTCEARFKCLTSGKDYAGFWIGGNTEDSSMCMTGFDVRRSTVSDKLKKVSCTGYKKRRPLCQSDKCGETFKISLDKSFNYSDETCPEGYQKAVIDTEEKQAAVVDFMTCAYEHYSILIPESLWIGGKTDDVAKGSDGWKWSDGKKIDEGYKNWKDDYPAHETCWGGLCMPLTEYKCLSLVFTNWGGLQTSWENDVCSTESERYALCQKKV